MKFFRNCESNIFPTLPCEGYSLWVWPLRVSSSFLCPDLRCQYLIYRRMINLCHVRGMNNNFTRKIIERKMRMVLHKKPTAQLDKNSHIWDIVHIRGRILPKKIINTFDINTNAFLEKAVLGRIWQYCFQEARLKYKFIYQI